MLRMFIIGIYMFIGYLLGTMGYGYDMWQFWAVMSGLFVVDVLSTVNALQ